MVDARILNQFDVSTGHKSVIQKVMLVKLMIMVCNYGVIS